MCAKLVYVFFCFFLHLDIQLFLDYLLKTLSFNDWPLNLCPKITDYIHVGLFLGFQFCSVALDIYCFTNLSLFSLL